MSGMQIFAMVIFAVIGTMGMVMVVVEILKPVSSLGMLDKATGSNLNALASTQEHRRDFAKLTSFQASSMLGANAMTIFLAVLAFGKGEPLAWWALWYWPIMFLWHFIIYTRNTPMWYMQLVWLALSISALLLNM